jgi:prolyl oligopeptidase
MKKIIIIMLVSSTIVAFGQDQIKYPLTKKTDKIDSYFGSQVADPYRWLEDDRSPETYPPDQPHLA